MEREVETERGADRYFELYCTNCNEVVYGGSDPNDALGAELNHLNEHPGHTIVGK